jgi:hypothetical protein
MKKSKRNNKKKTDSPLLGRSNIKYGEIKGHDTTVDGDLPCQLSMPCISSAHTCP